MTKKIYIQIAVLPLHRMTSCKKYDGSNKIAKKIIRDFDISFGDDLTRAESELEMEK